MNREQFQPTAKVAGAVETQVEKKEAIVVSAVQVTMVRQKPGQEMEVFLGLRSAGGFQNQWSTPGGKIDPGETAEQAAVREVLEETGVHVDKGDLLFMREEVSETVREKKRESTTEQEKKVESTLYQYKFKIFLLDAHALSLENASPEEYSDVGWMPVSKALEMHHAVTEAARGVTPDKIPGALTPRVADTLEFLKTFASVSDIQSALQKSEK